MNTGRQVYKSAGTLAIVLSLGISLTYCGGDGDGGAPAPPPPVVFSGAVSIETTLSGAAEVPPPVVATTGTGTGVLTVKPGTGELIGSVSFSGLTSSATVAHIHRGAVGVAGGAAIALTGGAGGTSGTWTVPAGTIMEAADITALINGGLYFNIHTVSNPPGEIRGQIIFPTASITTALSGAEEVPAVTTTGTGTGNITVNLGTGALSGSVTFSGLTSNATLAHIHRGAAGANGGAAIGLTGGAGGTSGTWTIPAGTVMTVDDLNLLITDGLYFNIHSVNNPGGEIRGQIKYRITLTPTLSGGQEVPPVVTAGTGTANLSINPATGDVSGTVTFSGLNGNATLAHIHTGAAGTNGGAAIALTGGAGATSGTWTVPTGSKLTTALLNALRADGLYVNIHSSTSSGGEIRGQLIHP